jgi:hypothetical protein
MRGGGRRTAGREVFSKECGLPLSSVSSYKRVLWNEGGALCWERERHTEVLCCVVLCCVGVRARRWLFFSPLHARACARRRRRRPPPDATWPRRARTTSDSATDFHSHPNKRALSSHHRDLSDGPRGTRHGSNDARSRPPYEAAHAAVIRETERAEPERPSRQSSSPFAPRRSWPRGATSCWPCWSARCCYGGAQARARGRERERRRLPGKTQAACSSSVAPLFPSPTQLTGPNARAPWRVLLFRTCCRERSRCPCTRP